VPGSFEFFGGERVALRERGQAFLGVLGVIALAVSDHRHRAVLLMVAVLVGMGALRLWTPGRPWFASRARLMDVAVYVILAAIIWWFAPYVSTLAVR